MRDEALLSTAADTQNKINMSSCSDNRTRRSWADVASDDSGETSNAPSIIKEFLDADEVPEELLEVERKGEATVVVGKSRDHYFICCYYVVFKHIFNTVYSVLIHFMLFSIKH